MKICAISPFRPIRGGIALNSTFLYNELSVKEDIYGLTYKKYLPKFKVANYKHRNSEVLPEFPVYEILNYRDPSSIITALKLIDKIKPELITFQWVTPIFLYQFIPFTTYSKKSGIPTLTTIHNVLPHEHSFIDYPIIKFAKKFLDKYLVHCETQREELVKIWRVQKKDVFVAPLARYRFKRVPKKYARKALGIGLDKNVVLFYGVVREYKGLDLLIKAIAQINPENIHLIICGAFMHKKTNFYKVLVGRLGISNKVTFLAGYSESDSLSLVFSASDLQILPYRTFSSQSAAGRIGEAFDLPLIVTPYGGLPELNGVFKIVKPKIKDLSTSIIEFFSEEYKQRINKVEENEIWQKYSRIFNQIKKKETS